MQKKIGFIFGVFFVLVAIVNFINNPEVFRLNVIGLGLIGFAFIESAYFGFTGKILQVLTMTVYSGIAVWGNDANSLVAVVTIIFAVLLSDKYFPNKRSLSKYYTMVPLLTSLLSDWNMASIINNVLLYFALTSVLFIIQNDKV